MHKFLAVGLVAALVAGSAQGRVICSGDSASVAIDSRVGVRESNGDETLTYSSMWDGGDDATVTITQNGTTLAADLTGEGEQAWSVEQDGTYTLTHTTFTNGVAGKVETAVFIVTGKGVPFEEGDVMATGYSGTYDGAAHGATVSVAAGIDGAVVRYASDTWGATCPATGWSSEPPVFSDAGEYAVWCEVSAPGYTPQVTMVAVAISPYDIGDAMVTLGEGLTYDGGVQTQSVASVSAGGLSVTYDTSGDVATNAGEYTLTVSGTGNFTGTVSRSYTVAHKDISDAEISIGASLTYNGAEQTQSVTGVTVDGLNATYTVSGNTVTDAGAYAMTVTGTGNFTGTATKPYTVARKDIAGAEISLGSPLTYNGSEQVQAVTGVTVDGLAATCAVSGNAVTDAGTYTLTVAGAGNFTGTLTRQFTVARRDIAGAVVTLGASLTYTGTEQEQTVANVTVDGLAATYAVSGNLATDAGTYALTLTGTGNFTGTTTKQYVVAHKDIAGATIALGESLAYNGTEQTQVVTGVTVDGLNATYTVGGNAATDAGTYTLTVTGTGNFTGTATKQYTIARKNIVGAEVSLGASLTYTGAEQTQSVAGVTIDGLDATYSVSGNTATDAGTYTLTVVGTGNFIGTVTVQWRIHPGEIVAEVISYEGVYDGEGHGISVVVTTPGNAVVKYEGGELGNEWTVEPPSFTNVGAATVWCVIEAANYVAVTNSGTVTVLPKPLTADMVALETLSFVCDGTAKEPAVTVADGEPSILTADDYDVNYLNNVEIGTATVTVAGKRNYEGTVVKTFEITPDSFTGGGATWLYVSRDGSVEMLGASVTGDVVAIPDEIDGVPVTALSDGCLAGNTELRGVVVGCNVTNMGARAFAGCENLSVVVFRGNAPEDIGQGLEWAPDGLEVYYENGEPDCPELSVSPATSIRNGRTTVTISRGAWSNVVTVRYTTDGSDPDASSAIYRSRFSVNVTALTVVRAAAFLGDVRVGRVVEMRYSPNLGDLLDVAALILQDGSLPVSFAVDTARPWWSDDDEDTLDGTPSMRSGEIGHDTASWMSATFEGAGVFEFSWKTSCEYDDLGEFWYDHAVCELDGIPVAWMDGETDWTRQTLVVTNGGVHTVTWSYVKDDDDDIDAEYEDCAWVDGVKFSRKVTVSFAGGGASGAVPANVVSATGYTVVLPDQGEMSVAKYAFAGWTDGTSTYAAGAEFDVPGADVTLTAVWTEKRLAAPTIAVAGTYDGYATPVAITTEAGASIWYTLDGSEPSADGSGSRLYQGAFSLEGSATIKAVATRDDWFDSDVAVARTARSWGTLEECLDNRLVDVFTSGDSPWYGVAMATVVNGTALRSGAIGDGQESRLYVGISGEGELSFRWKVSSETFKQFQVDYVSFSIDGTERAWIGGEVDWTNETFTITGAGEHLLRWTYKKDSGGRSGEDCAWVDGVVWTPSGADAGLAAWLAERGLTADTKAANGRTAAECYALGLDPADETSEFRIVSIELVDGKPKVEWEPKTNRWTGAEIRAVVKGAATLEGPWTEVPEGGNPAYRFFKVVVELP